MPRLRSTTLLDADPRTVAGLLRDGDVLAEALRRGGHGLSAPRRLLAAGDEVRLAVRVAPGVRIPVRARVLGVTPSAMTSRLAGGPLRALTHTCTLSPDGTLLDEVDWSLPFGPLGRAADVILVRGLVRRVLAARAAVLAERLAQLRAAPVVVATALVRDGRVLAAQRTRPPALAGRWELPGGRVEAGESEPDAVVRECREELGTAVHVTGRLGTDLPIDAGVLRVHTAVLADGAPDPQALEHSALRWVGVAELPDVAWVDADRAVLADLVGLLEGADSAP